MSVTHAITNLFDRRGSFLVLGLTGRTGSGCSTAAKLLSKPLAQLSLEAIASPLIKPEQRKYRIVREFAQKNWEPFTIISVTQTIASFVFSGEPKSIEDFFRGQIKSAQSCNAFLAEIERVRILWDGASKVLQPNGAATSSESELEAFFRIWEGEIKNFLGVARTVFATNFAQVFQTMGDNLRLSGTICSSTTEKNNFYTLPSRVGQIVVAARQLHFLKQQPARIVIDALRNPFEIQYFRDRFASFYLVAVTTPDKHRKSRLALLNLSILEIKKLDGKEYPTENKPLSGYSQLVSQNIQACIEKADIFIQNPGEATENQSPDLKDLAQQLLTFVCLMQHPGLITPSKIERCMQIAYSAKANSGCISRQVGAVVTDMNFSVRAVGWNDVPAGQVPCLLRKAEDLIEKNDDLAFSEYELHDEKFKSRISSRFEEFKAIQTGGRSSAFCFKSEFNSLDGKNKGNQVHTRSLHAEENAFLQISKYGGAGITGGILFSTASPCELCSKKAFQLGITQIFYIDPYPGISTSHILSSGISEMRPKVILFQGAVGQAFHRLYDPILPYKDEIEAFISPPLEQSRDMGSDLESGIAAEVKQAQENIQPDIEKPSESLL